MRATIIIFLSLITFTGNVLAGPKTNLVKINFLRPYTTGTFFVYLDASNTTMTIDNSVVTTCTSVFKVKVSGPGKDAVIAALFIAHSQDREIVIELPTGSTVANCEKWGTEIQSIYLH